MIFERYWEDIKTVLIILMMGAIAALMAIALNMRGELDRVKRMPVPGDMLILGVANTDPVKPPQTCALAIATESYTRDNVLYVTVNRSNCPALNPY